MSKDHQVKIQPYWFNEIINEQKKWEIRFNDRDYKPDDWLILFECDKYTKLYTGRGHAVEIINVHTSDFLPSKNYVLLSLGELCELTEENQLTLAKLVELQVVPMNPAIINRSDLN